MAQLPICYCICSGQRDVGGGVTHVVWGTPDPPAGRCRRLPHGPGKEGRTCDTSVGLWGSALSDHWS